MPNKDLMIITASVQTSFLTLEELCEISHLSTDQIKDLIEYDVITPQGRMPKEWLFDLHAIKRLQRALRLRRDFDLNLEGIAILLDVLEEVEQLRREHTLFEKHFL